MQKLAITYEVTMSQHADIDIDEIIEAVITNLKVEGKAINLDYLSYEFEDNVEYYLESLNMINDASLLSESTVETICEAFRYRAARIHPEYAGTSIQ